MSKDRVGALSSKVCEMEEALNEQLNAMVASEREVRLQPGSANANVSRAAFAAATDALSRVVCPRSSP